MGTKNLKMYFPMIQTREEILGKIQTDKELQKTFACWTERQQEVFLDICTGARGVKMLYDSFFKEILNPEASPERLEDLLSLLLKQKIRILKVLPNDTTRIADESSLLIMDIVVELENGSIANVECQKIGYAFPGQRAACYSADLLMRKYKQTRSEKGKSFSYRDIKKVYTIIFYEKSPAIFSSFPNNYIHRSRQMTDTGIQIDLLQEFIFIGLDMFFKIRHNKDINNKLEAWLTFLGSDDPEEIMNLIEQYPDFLPIYGDVYELCRNIEKVMGMFSKELLELDRNTVQYMIDEMQDTIDRQAEQIDAQAERIDAQAEQIANKDIIIDKLTAELESLKKK